MKTPNVAIAHSWIVLMGGAEQVLKSVCEIIPQKEIYSLVVDLEFIKRFLGDVSVKTSSLNKVPFVKDLYRNFLPVFPFFIESLTLKEDVDVLISLDAGLIKGVSNPRKVPHICYCHSPPRYLWDLQKVYEDTMEGFSTWKKLIFRSFLPYLRKKDLEYASGVDYFIANSNFVRNRIQNIYGKESEVIYPPVDIEKFKVLNSVKDDYYICVSRLVPYKRIDLAIKAAQLADVNLLVVGDGPERKALEKLVRSSKIKFAGSLSQKELAQKLAGAKAFLNPQVEDFGISSVEALAAGTPIIAYSEGGALEIVNEEVGLFFDIPTVESLADAIRRFERTASSYNSEICQKSAERFSAGRFKEQFRTFVSQKLDLKTPF